MGQHFFHYTAGNFIVGKEEKESMFPLYATIERNKEDGHDEMSGKNHGPGSPVPAAGPAGRVQGGPEAAGRKDRGVAGKDQGAYSH
jgi:hypothetical protein